jgi:hypothetical protein
MKHKIKERIIESGGRIVDDKIQYLKSISGWHDQAYGAQDN